MGIFGQFIEDGGEKDREAAICPQRRTPIASGNDAVESPSARMPFAEQLGTVGLMAPNSMAGELKWR